MLIELPPSGTAGHRLKIDLAVFDDEGGLLLLGEVKASDRDTSAVALTQLLAYCDALKVYPKYLLSVDRREIRLYTTDGPMHGSPAPQAVLDSATVFAEYDPSVVQKVIYEDYLAVLVATWLDDLAFRWKFSTPPGLAEVSGVGLAAALEHATVRTNIEISVR
jgi:hypothetical protein